MITINKLVILITLNMPKNVGYFANFEQVKNFDQYAILNKSKNMVILLILNKSKNVGYFADFR